MQPIRAVMRRRLDERLVGLEERVGPRPERGWIRAVRECLGMSMSELAGRMDVSATRVGQVEGDEVAGRIQLRMLERAAAALNCSVVYALVPRDPLEQMVRQQAWVKAESIVVASTTHGGSEDQSLLAEVISERVEMMTNELIDRRGLWAITYGGRAAQP